MFHPRAMPQKCPELGLALSVLEQKHWILISSILKQTNPTTEGNFRGNGVIEADPTDP